MQCNAMQYCSLFERDKFDDIFTFNNSCTRGHSLKFNVPCASGKVLENILLRLELFQFGKLKIFQFFREIFLPENFFLIMKIFS